MGNLMYKQAKQAGVHGPDRARALQRAGGHHALNAHGNCPNGGLKCSDFDSCLRMLFMRCSLERHELSVCSFFKAPARS